MTGFYTFTPAIFHACHLVQPSDRGECEISDAIPIDGWRVDVGYPEDRDEAERRLGGGPGSVGRDAAEGEATPD